MTCKYFFAICVVLCTASAHARNLKQTATAISDEAEAVASANANGVWIANGKVTSAGDLPGSSGGAASGRMQSGAGGSALPSIVNGPTAQAAGNLATAVAGSNSVDLSQAGATSSTSVLNNPKFYREDFMPLDGAYSAKTQPSADSVSMSGNDNRIAAVATNEYGSAVAVSGR